MTAKGEVVTFKQRKEQDIQVSANTCRYVFLGKLAPSGLFTAVPNWNFWNTGRKNLSSRSETYEIWSKWIRSGGIHNPKLHPPIPIWDLDARLAGKQ
ncbi:hypothetical protein AVEN_223278-1 [Araneus ventricosus]|uniref:Uncharacterized protein n=1 Tax=Araneus ventricosus TaxID=182803 RepID=A0A4Y2EPN4_ARAVE|nr:hypothetical protein AVEN_223278-1 [Araneus ventricosus]